MHQGGGGGEAGKGGGDGTGEEWRKREKGEKRGEERRSSYGRAWQRSTPERRATCEAVRAR